MRFVERYRIGALSFRSRLTLVAAAAVAASTIAASVAIYFFVQAQLVGEVDSSLRSLVPAVSGGSSLGGPVPVKAGVSFGSTSGTARQVLLGGAPGYFQTIYDSGQTTLPPGESVPLPVTSRDLAVATGTGHTYFHDEYVAGTHVRVLTIRTGRGALQVARPMNEVDSAMASLRLLLIGMASGAVLLAAVLGALVARAALAPVHRLSEAVDHITVTGDLTRSVPDAGSDELSRLGANFNRMLATLRQSLQSQRQLVADASHELRTPLASLRTNVEVLQRAAGLPVAERRRLVRDLVLQSEQLTRLVHGLIDLARHDQPMEAVGEVQLDAVVEEAVERAASHWPQVTFARRLDCTSVRGDPDRIERAVTNLLDNAGKWSPPGGVVEVGVAGGEVTVRDHGPGIDPRDVPHVFDRFWRAPAARSLPGSGLGLSIVKQVADAHGARVCVEAAEGGGTLMRLRFAGSQLPARLNPELSRTVGGS
ncbi:MAG: HAMP domain-containing histidine kinase [Candidatus Dormibacteraeota bacterium]|nr:HAMP domain-containing histidine kinase [Candidatus Dormibacteraeota bacterium]